MGDRRFLERELHINETQATHETGMLYAQQVKLLYKNAFVGIVGTLVNSTILTIVLWNAISHRALISWLFCSFLLALPRCILVYRYNHTSIKPHEAGRWAAWLIIGLASSGVIWGSTAIFLFAAESIAHQVFLSFVLAGMVAGGLVIFSVIRGAFLAYSVPALIPIMVRFFAQGNDIQIAMGGMTLLFTVLILVSAERIHATIVFSLKLQLENEGLIIGLASEKNRIEVLNEKLQSRISKQRQTEAALTSEREQLLSVFDSINEIIYVADPKTYEILYANKALKNALKKETVGDTCYKAFQGLEAPCDFCTNEIILKEKGGPYQWEHHNPILSQDFWITDKIIKWPDGRDVRFELAINITSRKQTENALRESEEHYRSTMDASLVGIYIIQDLIFKYVNPTMAEFFGYTSGEMENKLSPIDTTIPEQRDMVRQNLIKRSEGIPGKPYEVKCCRKDGSTFDAMVWGKAVKHLGRSASVGTMIDITEHKQLEAQLLHAQKMEAIGTLAGGISHDFNNILQAVSGYTQLLLMKKGEDDPDRDYLNQVSRSVQRAAGLVRQLLIFSRKVESKLRPVDINQEVAHVRRLLERTIPRMVDIELHLADDIKIINADSIQLEQIVMNLAVNARDAMPDGGRLIIETENIVLDEEYCKIHLEAVPGEYVLLTVSDTGHGMDSETKEHIFEPFYTTKEEGKGTGLGLATVYGIVKSHGGYIMCYSEPGHGATFKVYFPVLEAEITEQVPERKEVEEIRGGDETILLVDDEESILDIGRDTLGRYGYTTITAKSGEEAIEVYEKERNRIDLVILDIGMPGMGGHGCLQELLRIDPEIKVVITSGYSASGRAKETLEAGAAGFIGKPYQLDDMLRKAREVLDKKQGDIM